MVPVPPLHGLLCKAGSKEYSQEGHISSSFLHQVLSAPAESKYVSRASNQLISSKILPPSLSTKFKKISRGDDETFPAKGKVLRNRFAVDQPGSGRRRIKEHEFKNSPATHWSATEERERERLMLKRASM